MNCFTLPDPTPIEKRVMNLIGPGLAEWSEFAGGEMFVSVRGVEESVCLVGRTGPSGVDLFRTALLADTLRRNGATQITAVIPYFAYARQDRRHAPGDAVTGAFAASQLACAGVTRIVTADLHSNRIREGTTIPIVSVDPLPDMAPALRRGPRGEFTVVAPDRGSAGRAERLAALLGRPGDVLVFEKKRTRFVGVAVGRPEGRVAGASAVIVDDMLDTGATVAAAVVRLKEQGFRVFSLCATHPLFTGDAVKRIRRLKFSRIVCANTIPMAPRVRHLKGFVQVDLSRRLVAAVR